MATVLKVIYNKSYEVYKTVTSADVDVGKFSELIMSSIGKVRKMIPRCDDAFDRIIKSVDLLKGNFDGYYRDFVQTQNPLTLVTNFVYDVASQDGVDAKVTFQFRKIMQFYQKHTQGKIKDPRVKKVFELLSSNMSILENENVNEIKRMEAEDVKQSDLVKNMENLSTDSNSGAVKKKRKKRKKKPTTSQGTPDSTPEVDAPEVDDDVDDDDEAKVDDEAKACDGDNEASNEDVAD